MPCDVSGLTDLKNLYPCNSHRSMQRLHPYPIIRVCREEIVIWAKKVENSLHSP